MIKEKYIKLANVILNYPKSYISTKEKAHSGICCVSPGDSNDNINYNKIYYTILKKNNFTNKIYNNDYLINGIKVMKKKYLFPFLESQIVKKFTWIL